MHWEDLKVMLSGGSKLEPTEILVRLLLAFILTSVIAVIYSKSYKGYGRPAQMALVLVLVSLATCGIIMAIGDNLALSLGMVGALSIVRFRAAVKDNRDLAYLFWTLTVGLVCGAGAYLLAILLLVFLGIVVLVLERFELFETATRKFIVILSQKREAEQELTPIGELLPKAHTLKATVYHRDSGVEESTYLVDFSDSKAIDAFKQAAQALATVTGYQILGPEDTILG